jgi:hypothetical protein
MHTYRIIDTGTFEVGYYTRDVDEEREDLVTIDVWNTLSTHASEHLAILRVNFLNGGSTVSSA